MSPWCESSEDNFYSRFLDKLSRNLSTAKFCTIANNWLCCEILFFFFFFLQLHKQTFFVTITQLLLSPNPNQSNLS